MTPVHPRADRAGNAYVPHYIMRLKLGRLMVGWMSPARQAKKASGLHGRQWVRARKAAQRARRHAERAT